MRRQDNGGAAGAVVERARTDKSRGRHKRLAVKCHTVAGRDLGTRRLGRESDVDTDLVDFRQHAVVIRQMRRHGTDDAGQRARRGVDRHLRGGQGRAVHTAAAGHAQKSVVVNKRHDHADAVHMRRQKHMRPALRDGLHAADQRAEHGRLTRTKRLEQAARCVPRAIFRA